MKSIVRSLLRQRGFDGSKLKHGMRFPAIGGLLAAPLAVFALAAPAHAQPLSAADQQFVDATVASAMQDGGQPGMSIAITGPRGDYAKAYGIASSIPKRALSLDDHFRIGSITKSFTATAILMQVEQGKLSLDDTLDKFVTGVPNGNLITIRHMLMMRSGVYDYQSDPLIAFVFTLFPTWTFSPAGALQSIRSHPSQFTPGTQYQYTNSNYQLLGMVLEKVTGKSYQNVIKDDILTPLGLTQTTFPTNSSIQAPYAKGYSPLALGIYRDVTAINPALFGAAGAMTSTIGDMQKWAAAMRDGTLLSPEMQALRETTFCPVPYTGEGPTAFGYGLGYISFGRWFGHDGSVPGYGTEAFYDPQTGAVIVGMETMQTSGLAIFGRVMERIGAELYPGSMDTPAYPTC